MSSTYEDSLIGERLKEIRLKKSLSQQLFADSLGVSLRTYQNYERGQRPISKELLCALIEQYEVDISWLLAGNEGYPHHVPVSEITDQQRIDERVFMEVVDALADSSAKPSESKEFSRFAAFIYNNVADEDDPVFRAKKIRGTIQLMEMSSGLRPPESIEDLADAASGSSKSVKQKIAGSGNQVAGGNFHNHGDSNGGRGGKK